MRPKLFFQALLGIVSVGAIIMIVIVYFFGDNTKVVEKVVEKQVIVYQPAPAAVTPVENHTVVQQPAAPVQVPVVESVTPVDVSTPAPVAPTETPTAAPAAGTKKYTVDDLLEACQTVLTSKGIPNDVFLDGDTVTIVLYDPSGETSFALLAISGGNEDALEFMKSSREQIIETSAEIKEIADKMELYNTHISVLLANPLNTGSALFVTYDNQITYDFITEDLNGNT